MPFGDSLTYCARAFSFSFVSYATSAAPAVMPHTHSVVVKQKSMA